jgi:sigma-E factor negative regulatory protein RseB
MAAMRAWFFAGLWVLCSYSFANQTDTINGRALADISKKAPPAVKSGLAETDPLVWLDRLGAASRQLNYVGTFSYQTGSGAETSRIVHRYANGEESERLEVLDGSPREVIRRGKSLQCVLPAQRTVIVGRLRARVNFPGRLPQNHAELTGNYSVRLGGTGRIAGHEAQKLILEPRDKLRFAHVLWAEQKSGLLLKSQVINDKGKVVEQFAFSDVRIGTEIDDKLLAPRVKIGADWHRIDVGGDDETLLKDKWRFKESLPGFALRAMMRHRSGGVLQIVFNDGLATVSIFIEPVEATVKARGAYSGGGMANVFERIVDGHRITALGEVPEATVQRMAEAVEMRK